jgi:probable rRNA maturation factor
MIPVVPENSIDFFSEGIDFQLDTPELVCSWLKKVLIAENKKLDAISYIFCNDSFLLEINKTYLNHDDYTDVISFPYENDPVEGDIFISIDRIIENSKTLNNSFINELHRVMVHGLLHLAGYEDKTALLKEKMTEKESFYLNQRSF